MRQSALPALANKAVGSGALLSLCITAGEEVDCCLTFAQQPALTPGGGFASDKVLHSKRTKHQRRQSVPGLCAHMCELCTRVGERRCLGAAPRCHLDRMSERNSQELQLGAAFHYHRSKLTHKTGSAAGRAVTQGCACAACSFIWK